MLKVSTLLSASVLLLTFGAFAGCGSDSKDSAESQVNSTSSSAALAIFANQNGKIDIAGGTAHIPVMKKAAEAIMASNPNITITITGGGTGAGITKVGEGLADIGNTGRALKPQEIEKYHLISFPFAVDGVAIAVHKENSLSNLTKEQASQIFSGAVKNWSELGGSEGAINLYVREDGSGTRDTFESKGLNKDTEIPQSANVVSSNGAMKIAIAQDKNAIGYVGIGHLDDSIKGISFEGVEPNQEKTKEGAYAISRLLYMNTKGQPQGLTKLFVDYIYSEDGAEFIEQSGYIPLPK
ncbi:phosphate ABC transporter substrate-binding protein [Helicobacter sp. MIT 05-5294]|uniref:phosphate ABC transporter substrate-binding protein n=1 Tax=Helicobacter sp. MIT 05-5294 TaxID=1548150 RepID=UPI0010FD5438|nr:phosphate ABC transporter substrate-binding protein [Helicobacter sp. MIT 05-5294]TLD86312.1 phosphate ABC transporter substrate-binding protein [Helicobacter sp. MIT 05-5294]